jgi:hypothetical protein
MGTVSLRKQTGFLKHIIHDKKRGHMPPFFSERIQDLAQQDTTILNKERCEYETKDRRQFDQDVQRRT